MDLDMFIIAVFCRMDDALKSLFQEKPLRQRRPAPVLSDAEVLTMEVVGEFLGFSQDTALFRYFRQHYRHFFPGLERVHRTTFVRQPLEGQGVGVAAFAGLHPTQSSLGLGG